MKIKLLLILFLSLFLLNPAYSNSSEEKKVIRVALSNQSFSNYEHDSVRISSDNMVSIIDLSKNGSDSQIYVADSNRIIEVIMQEGLFYIFSDGNLIFEKLQGPLLFSSNDDLKIINLNRKGTPAKYKGMIELRLGASKKKFNIINVIDTDNYLRGVVPNEMPVSFGLEALKAQAIAARNYATNASMSPNYDLVDSTAAQVYYGANSYSNLSDTAVNRTKGIYALYNEKPITALYFSTSGGITDDWDDVFADGTNYGIHPYLKARYDKAGQKPLRSEDDVKAFYSNREGGIDTNSPKYRWNIEFERKELEDILHTTLIQQSKAGLVSPKYDGSNKIEGLKELKPIKRTQSGKITELSIIAKNGEWKVKKELGIRRVLKKNNAMLPSANFFVETSGYEKLSSENEETIAVNDNISNNENSSEEIEKGTLFKFISNLTDKYPKTFKLTGGGFGHGVGMSQFGAYNMAKMGRKYPEILNHYYSNINLSTMPRKVLYNDYNISYKTEFYFDKSEFKKAYLLINNSRNVNHLPFKINDYEFSDTSMITKNKVSKIDITDYLINGLNVVDFEPLSRENKGKYAIYRVEFL